jgi:5-methylcytosine-specific restriction endonuclease McrA
VTLKSKREYAKQWNKDHPDAHRKHCRDWARNHREESRQRNAIWQKENPEKARAKLQAWRAKNRQKKIEYDRTRRVKKNGASGYHTSEQFKDLCFAFKNMCVCCLQDKPLTEDHIVPLSKGGTDNIENIQPLCKSCNSKKHNTHSVDYRITLILAYMFWPLQLNYKVSAKMDSK